MYLIQESQVSLGQDRVRPGTLVAMQAKVVQAKVPGR